MTKTIAILILAAAAALPVSGAQAFGLRTKMACASDYYAYCSQHSISSPGVRQCMSAAGPKLSKGCVNALIADGEVSRSEVERRQAALR